MDLAPDARAHLLRLAAGTPPTGALALAYVPEHGERVGVVVSGGNTTAVDFGR